MSSGFVVLFEQDAAERTVHMHPALLPQIEADQWAERAQQGALDTRHLGAPVVRFGGFAAVRPAQLDGSRQAIRSLRMRPMYSAASSTSLQV